MMTSSSLVVVVAIAAALSLGAVPWMMIGPGALRVVMALDVMGARITFKDGVLRIRPPPLKQQQESGINFVVPPKGTMPSSRVLDSIEIRKTKSKGYGAFAIRQIDEGTFLGFYEGTVVKGRENLERLCQQRHEKLLQNAHDGLRDDNNYGELTQQMCTGLSRSEISMTTTSAMDYVMSLDGGVTFLDGHDRAQDRSKFSPVHLNHSDKGTLGCNCVRLLDDDDGTRVAFFTRRRIETDEELCFSYGDNFWTYRSDKMI